MCHERLGAAIGGPIPPPDRSAFPTPGLAVAVLAVTVLWWLAPASAGLVIPVGISYTIIQVSMEVPKYTMHLPVIHRNDSHNNGACRQHKAEDNGSNEVLQRGVDPTHHRSR